MTHPLAIFNYEGIQIRTVERNGVPMFFAQDVAQILGYSATSAMLKRLDADEADSETFLEGTTYKKQSLINESGLYTAVLGSQLESAKKFKKWVTSEVLPTIRKTGTYGQTLIPQTLPEALRLAADLAEQNAALVPKAAIADRLTGADGNMSLRNAAKALKLRESDFIKWLQLHKWIFRNKKGRLEGYASHIPRFVEHKVTPIPIDDDQDRVSLQAMITAEGLTKLASIFNVELKEAA